jgi:hypothetical protein
MQQDIRVARIENEKMVFLLLIILFFRQTTKESKDESNMNIHVVFTLLDEKEKMKKIRATDDEKMIAFQLLMY